MCHSLLQDSSLFSLLRRMDEQLAAAARAAGCPCGGVLHRARYPRKPRGGPEGLGPECRWRLSYCCGEEGCRRRVTPFSVLFLGRRVFFGVVVVLVSALQEGPVRGRLARVQEAMDGTPISRRTLRRWERWWREGFVQSRFWMAARGLLGSAVDEGRLPGSLLEAFVGGDGRARLILLLRFLRPITSFSAPGSLAF